MGRRKKLTGPPMISFHKDLKISTRLVKNGKTIMISLKDGCLKIESFDKDGTVKTVETHKYILGDIALWKYCYSVKMYMRKGYAENGTVSNFETVIKDFKKSGKGNTNVEEQKAE